MFKAFISLGAACMTAASMEKYGLRDGSYPFGWVVSQLYGVFHFLENDFEDFLCRENLSEDGKRFYDGKWRIHFFHDGSITAEGEYDNICEKYKHRIQRFRETVQEGKVCFVRAIIDQAEVCWIKENSEYILKIINKFPESEIVFLAHQGLGEMKNFPFRLYMLNIYGWMTDTRYQLRSAFDTNEKFISYCQANYSEQKLLENKKFDEKKEVAYAEKENRISHEEREKFFLKIIDGKNRQIAVERSRVNRILEIINSDLKKLQKEETIVIYGAGDIGKLLADRICNQVDIKCFLDQKPYESNYHGVPILKPSEYEYDEKSLIVVVPSYDYDGIVLNLKKLYGQKVKCISVGNFCKTYSEEAQ